MNREQLKKLEKDLWAAADKLRANFDLNTSEYSTPVLRLIFLRFPELSAAGEIELHNRLSSVSKEWAEALDKRGKPGSLVLKAYHDELAKHKK